MRKLIVTFETVTPMLLRGADNGAGSIPEIRPPAFRGMFRYWFRAAAGAVVNEGDVNHLEGLVFGMAGQKESTSSPIAIKHVSFNMDTGKAFILPHKKQGARNAFNEFQEFDLEIIAARPVSDLIWKCFLASIELNAAFGGVGLRVRRGYGTIRIKKVSGSDEIHPSPQTEDGWLKYLDAIVQNAYDVIQKLAVMEGVRTLSLPPVGPCGFPCANQTSEIILSAQTKLSPTIWLETFMDSVPKVAYLGGSGKGWRQSSPLWIRPVEVGNKKFALLLVSVPSVFTGSKYSDLSEFMSRYPGKNIKIKGWNQ